MLLNTFCFNSGCLEKSAETVTCPCPFLKISLYKSITSSNVTLSNESFLSCRVLDSGRPFKIVLLNLSHGEGSTAA